MTDATPVASAVAKFPAEFGLRAFPGERFRVSPRSSYVSEGKVMLYAQIKRGDAWLDFAKGTVAELSAEVVDLAPHASDCASWVAEPCDCATGKSAR